MGGEAEERKVEDVVMEEGEGDGKGGDSEMKDVVDKVVAIEKGDKEGEKEDDTEKNKKDEEEDGKVEKAEKEEGDDEEDDKNEGDDEEEDEEGEEEDKKEPVTPSEGRPSRERKMVERLSMITVARPTTPKSVTIVKVIYELKYVIFCYYLHYQVSFAHSIF